MKESIGQQPRVAASNYGPEEERQRERQGDTEATVQSTGDRPRWTHTQKHAPSFLGGREGVESTNYSLLVCAFLYLSYTTIRNFFSHGGKHHLTFLKKKKKMHVE